MGPPGTPLDHAEIIARLRLIRSENVGPVTFGHLLRRYGDASRALAALPELAAQGGLSRRIRIHGRAEAEAELEANYAIGARVIVLGMAEYPTLLEQCEDATAVFSLRGHGNLLARPAVAMVGARNASANARRLAHALAEPSRRRITWWFPAWPAALTPPPIRARFPAARGRCWAAALMLFTRGRTPTSMTAW